MVAYKKKKELYVIQKSLYAQYSWETFITLKSVIFLTIRSLHLLRSMTCRDDDDIVRLILKCDPVEERGEWRRIVLEAKVLHGL